jgi:hypothetical protein
MVSCGIRFSIEESGQTSEEDIHVFDERRQICSERGVVCSYVRPKAALLS